MPVIIAIISIILIGMIAMAFFRFMMNYAANVLQYLPHIITMIILICLSTGFLSGWIIGCIKTSKKMRFILIKSGVNVDEIVNKYATGTI